AFGGEDTPGFELGDAFPARCGSRQIFKKQKPVGCIPVWRGLRKSGMALQRRHLRREDNTRAGGTVIERLFAKAIAHQKKAAGGSLAIGKGEHSVDALDRAPHALATNEMKKGFRIGMVAQSDAALPQFGRESPVAVYFAIINKCVSRGFIDTRLCAAGEIDDG